jgi:hypothetical protein
MYVGRARVWDWVFQASLVTVTTLLVAWPSLLAQGSLTPQNTGTDEVELQVIVVRSPEEAQQVIERLKKGTDFSQLAREKSIDPTAENGGFMGRLSLGALRGELRDALKGVGPGQIAPTVHLPSGYTILKVVDPGVSSGSAAKDPDPARNFALAASGAIPYVLDVDGLSEAQAVILHHPKDPNWNWDPREVCAKRKESLAAGIEHLTNFLSPEKAAELAGRPPIDIMQSHYSLAQLYAYNGNMEPAIAEFQQSYQIALSDVPAAIPQMEETLGIVYLHESEMENEAYSNPKEKDLFPMRPGNAYQKTGDSEKAIEYFLKYLEKKPNDLEVRWLINVAYMTVGKYPADVPEKYLIPPATFE